MLWWLWLILCGLCFCVGVMVGMLLLIEYAKGDEVI